MDIQGWHIMKAIGKKYANARKPMDRWANIVLLAKWKTPHDVRETFADVSFVGETAIFDLGGNNFRLLSRILSSKQLVVVYNILTHSKYDKWRIQ